MFGLKRILGRAIGPSRVMAIAIAALVLSACGQRGPLYLPGPDEPKTTRKPAPTAPADTPATPAPR